MATRRFSPVILSISLVLAGCATTKPKTTPNNAQVEVDRQILEASRKIQFAQAELYQAGAVNQETTKVPIPITDDRQHVTLSWQGDALQLVTKLARDRGLDLSVMGVRMPLPVNIDVKNTPYSTVIQMLRAQIGYRAEISEQSDTLVLQYNRPQP
jgi:defect-in-organelle-trafficking protein DotD